LAVIEKKADKNGLPLTIWDESGLSFSPNVGTTWAPVGETPILLETPGRHNHTMLGFIVRSPIRHDLRFRYTAWRGTTRTEDVILFLTELHYRYGIKVMIVWDHLSAHHSAESYFCDEHPDWFEFHYFPSYSPELNPVESCWHHIKKVSLANFVPSNDEELVQAILESAQRINDWKLLPKFFNYVGIKP
jgi:transposase